MTTDRSWTTEAQSALDLTKAVPARTTGAVDETPAGTAYAALKDAARVAWACGDEHAENRLNSAAAWVNSGDTAHAVKLVEELLREQEQAEQPTADPVVLDVLQAARDAESPQEAVEAAEARADEHGLAYETSTEGPLGCAAEGGATRLRWTGAYAGEPDVAVYNDGRGWSADLEDAEPPSPFDAPKPGDVVTVQPDSGTPWLAVVLRYEPDGAVRVRSAANEHGSGQRVSFDRLRHA